MISKTRKNIEIMGLQRPSVNFNELPYITLKASPKRKVVGSNPARNGSAAGDFAIKAGSGGIFAPKYLCSNSFIQNQ